MAKKWQVEFLRWFGPLLYALRDLGDFSRPHEVSARIAKNLSLGDEDLDATLKPRAGKLRNQVASARQQRGLIPLYSWPAKDDCPP